MSVLLTQLPPEASGDSRVPARAERAQGDGKAQQGRVILGAVAIRRQHVEQLLREGLSNKEIAHQLGISVSVDTIKKDIQSICDAAGVGTSREYFAKLLHDISPKRS